MKLPLCHSLVRSVLYSTRCNAFNKFLVAVFYSAIKVSDTFKASDTFMYKMLNKFLFVAFFYTFSNVSVYAQTSSNDTDYQVTNAQLLKNTK
jgi:hypothetical protein